MIWTNPWAWAGLAAVGVPVLIHLLARTQTPPLPFPTLRFLPASALIHSRRRRLTDLPLLLVRAAIIALAVAALAGPHLPAAAPPTPRLAIIVDTSASVASDAASAAAARLRDESTSGVAERAMLVIEHADLRGAVAEASGWLRSGDGAGVLAVVSDFQRGAVDPQMLAALPPDVGVRLVRVDMRASTAGPSIPGVAHWSAGAGGATAAAWSAATLAASGVALEADPAIARAVLEAAAATADARTGELRPATFVLPGSRDRDALLASSTEPRDPWLYHLHRTIGGADVGTVRMLGHRAGIFLASDDPARAADAIAAALPMLAHGESIAEHETSTLSDAELAAIAREPSPRAHAPSASAPVARWFWLAALLLLGVETWLRRDGRTRVEMVRAA